MSSPRKALILDVDGVVSPVHGNTAWGDEVIAGHVFGPVAVSPAMCERLDLLGHAADLGCWWLPSWSAEMRARMDPFPGRGWPAIAEEPNASTIGRTWWKVTAVEAWLDRHPATRALAWCDDQLRGGRPSAVRRRLGDRGLEPLLLSPRTSLGLTPAHLDLLEAWAYDRRPPRHT
ncbi:HAD domain-containing protein [Nocardioides sp. MAHUQ-72]|uniref:HAD domain-containing protein n=1 Tax=unclassified Nocardioides TaxID=2615069 RepID=UPI0036098ADE